MAVYIDYHDEYSNSILFSFLRIGWGTSPLKTYAKKGENARAPFILDEILLVYKYVL